MIPTHKRPEKERKEIVLHQLQALTEYDSTQAHRYNYFEFFVFEKGGGTHLIDFELFPIETNSIHIVAPGQVHQVKRELDSNGFAFLFDLDILQTTKNIEDFLFDHICLDVNEFPPNYFFDCQTETEIIHLAKNAWTEYQSDNLLKNSFVQTHLTQLILHCMRKRNVSEIVNDAHQNSLYVAFRRLLKEEFKNMKMVKEYANHLSVSDKSLNEVVHQRTGMTASALIYKQLVLEAKRLLNTGISAKEVAYELNFADPAHFSKFFKSKTGQSPSDFRNVQD